MEHERRTISILGCGWLGLPLGAHLAARGHRVKGSTTRPEKLAALADAGIAPHLLRIDPEPSADLPAAFFDADVLFLNIPPSRRHPDVAAAFPAQVEAVRRAVAASPVRLLVFASATSVYPDGNGEVAEGDAGEAVSASGRALWASERLLRDGAGCAVTVLRFAGLYGYDRQPGRFLAGRRDLPGGDAPVNLVHRDDAVAVTAAVIERDVRGAVLNVCADAHPPRRRFYPREAQKLGLAPPTFTDVPAPFKVVSNRALKERLGYRFLHPDPMQDAP